MPKFDLFSSLFDFQQFMLHTANLKIQQGGIDFQFVAVGITKFVLISSEFYIQSSLGYILQIPKSNMAESRHHRFCKLLLNFILLQLVSISLLHSVFNFRQFWLYSAKLQQFNTAAG